MQVTRFIFGGFALGIRVNHTMADAYGMMQFLSSISELMKGASAPSISPVWQREQYLIARSPPRITCIHHEYEQIPQSIDFMDSDKLFRTAIFFTPKVIQALYNHLSLSGSSQRCSRFDLIIACLWKIRTNALNPSDPDETVRLSVLTNVRGKPSLNIPTGYCGNAFVYPAAVSTTRILCTAPLSYVVQLIQNAKAQMSEEYIKSVADLMVIKKRPKYATDWNFIVSDITRIGFEKIDLGWNNAVFGGVDSATSNISFCTNFKNSKGEDGVVVMYSNKWLDGGGGGSSEFEVAKTILGSANAGRARWGILCTAPLSYAVPLIQNDKAQMSEEYNKSVADLIVIKNRPKYAIGWNFIVSDINRLDFEKIDLGWGNAVYGGVALATSNVSFCTNFKNSKGEDGVVVPICLTPLAVENFKYKLEKMTCEQLRRM
ncbi:methanol O-anthraniloyltransferase-like [Olea europaea subsp. europaea]|uniref:Methanol O-anthraniloyltransferase-like n=1 Tax=Olea europaea subsp. europaea TaxID=158383 RepID=A0A8S0PFV3_OLEEU|nr:methanol O-anthraniloyltransferase-like [Olea europaea subsp. europaea]